MSPHGDHLPEVQSAATISRLLLTGSKEGLSREPQHLWRPEGGRCPRRPFRSPHSHALGPAQSLTMDWTGHDAVALTAIAIGGGPSLDALIASIDVCNHDVPPFEVVGPSLGRLAGAGLIEQNGSGFRLTRLGGEVVKATTAATIERVGRSRRGSRRSHLAPRRRCSPAMNGTAPSRAI